MYLRRKCYENSDARPRSKRPVPSHGKERPISTRIYVGNLSFRTTEEQLTTTLAAAGQITNVHIGVDRETGRSRGFAFVEFASEAEAAEAIRRFDGQEVDGRKLRVNTAHDRPRRPGGGGGGARFGHRSDRPNPAALSGPRVTDLPSSQGVWDPVGGYPQMDSRGRGSGGGPGGPAFKNKGSRRGLRARKRSLNF